MEATWLQHFVLTFRMKVKMKRRMKARSLRMNEGDVDSGFDECAKGNRWSMNLF